MFYIITANINNIENYLTFSHGDFYFTVRKHLCRYFTEETLQDTFLLAYLTTLNIEYNIEICPEEKIKKSMIYIL